MTAATKPWPLAFLWRRLHSLTGLWLVLYLIEHLLVNSRAAMLVGDDSTGFIAAVNAIHELPYLRVIELVFLGIPIVIHGIWGVKYLFTARYNSGKSDGSEPSLQEYPRNHAYSWQRITSWLLLIGIVAHVVHMRFVEFPESVQRDGQDQYAVRVTSDASTRALSQRLSFSLHETDKGLVAVVPDFGTAELLVVRETFKMPIMIALYTIFVLAACFHAFNGLWTFMISWGVTLNSYSQRLMRGFATFLMILVAFLGLAAIWGNLLHGPENESQQELETKNRDHYGS
jgi:succinate dehydrogenase / fumarate reductase cytochrome b subunit